MKEELLHLLDERDPLLQELSRLLVLLGGFVKQKSNFKVIVVIMYHSKWLIMIRK